jgi:hypothetical protein
MLLHNMSSSVTTGNSSAAHTQFFTKDTGLQLQLTVSAFPSSAHSDSGAGDCFRGLTTVRLRYDLLLCLPSLFGADQICIQPSKTFTSGLSTVWSPAPSPDITTVPTGKLALAGLSPARSSTSFTALTGSNLCTRSKSHNLERLDRKRANDWPVMPVIRELSGMYVRRLQVKRELARGLRKCIWRSVEGRHSGRMECAAASSHLTGQSSTTFPDTG